MRLSHRDYQALEQAVYNIHEYRDLNRFREEIPAILTKLIPAEHFFWAEYTINPVSCEQVLTDFVESPARLTPELAQRVADGIMKHPFTEYFLKGNEQTALILSDFLTQTQLRNSFVYDQVYRSWGFRYVISIPVRSRLGTAAGVGMNDGKKDFTERDRFMLNAFRRHFDRAHRNAELATIRSTSLAEPLAAYKLTPREVEIAHWLALGKSNPEIAVILQRNVRTIEKHMEKILEKLRVENRFAAALLISRAKDASPDGLVGQ